MAYPHFQLTVPILSTAGDPVLNVATTGDKGGWAAGPASYIVRRVAIQFTTTGTTLAAVVSFRKACGGAASATGGQFARITAGTAGKREDGMYFNDSFTPHKIPAGYRIVMNVVTATTDLCRAWALIEPSPERLQNLGTGAFISVTA